MITFREFLNLCEDYNLNAEFVIYNKNTRVVLGTARGFDQAKGKASSIRKQRGLKSDDVWFMASRRFYGRTSEAPSGGRRIYLLLSAMQVLETVLRTPGTFGDAFMTWSGNRK